MAEIAAVLKELEQEHALSLDQVIQVIGNLVGRNGTGIRIKTKRSKRTLSAAARKKRFHSHRRLDGQRQGARYWHPCATDEPGWTQ